MRRCNEGERAAARIADSNSRCSPSGVVPSRSGTTARQRSGWSSVGFGGWVTSQVTGHRAVSIAWIRASASGLSPASEYSSTLNSIGLASTMDLRWPRSPAHKGLTRPPEADTNSYRLGADGPGMARRVVRLGVSIEPELLKVLDEWVAVRNSGSRSDAIRSLIRKELAEESLTDPEADAVGCLMLLFRHDLPEILERVTAAEHRWGEHIRSSSHVHLEGGSCMQILGLAGNRRELESAAEDLRGIRGVAYGGFVLGTPSVVGGATGHRHPHRPGGLAEPSRPDPGGAAGPPQG